MMPKNIYIPANAAAMVRLQCRSLFRSHCERKRRIRLSAEGNPFAPSALLLLFFCILSHLVPLCNLFLKIKSFFVNINRNNSLSIKSAVPLDAEQRFFCCRKSFSSPFAAGPRRSGTFFRLLRKKIYSPSQSSNDSLCTARIPSSRDSTASHTSM